MYVVIMFNYKDQVEMVFGPFPNTDQAHAYMQTMADDMGSPVAFKIIELNTPYGHEVIFARGLIASRN